MATLPATYPSIPYLGMIPGGLHHGLMIRINGEMLHDRFNVNIQTGPILNPLDDVNLHLSVRPNEGAIVRNTLTCQQWGAEERMGGCPIQYGQRFEILILSEMDQFKVAINGRHFCEFRHRLPLSSCRFVHVSGQVKIDSIKVEGDPNTMPPSAPSAPQFPAMSYQPPPYNSYQPPPHLQYIPPNPYGNMSTSMTAVPSNQPSYPSGQYYAPQQQAYYYQPEQTLYSQPYQQYPSYHSYQVSQQPAKSSTGSTALKYAAGIGGIGLGAYAVSRMFDSDGSNSD